MKREKTLKSHGGRPSEFLDDQIEDQGVVAFDFDGTITVRDSFIAFLKWRAGGLRYAAGMVKLAPSGLAYLGHRNRGRIKAAATREFLAGATRAELEAEAKTFAEEAAPYLLRGDAIQAWKRWRTRRAKLVIVTASPDIIVAPFARGLGADALIATELAFDMNDRATGGFSTPNCRGPEKVKRLKAVFGEDLQLKAAYGDTSGDREMLKIADHRGYRVFKSRP